MARRASAFSSPHRAIVIVVACAALLAAPLGAASLRLPSRDGDAGAKRHLWHQHSRRHDDAGVVNLTSAVIVVGPPATGLMRTAAEMLAGIVMDGTGLRWPVLNHTAMASGGAASAGEGGAVVLLTAASSAEVDRASPRAEGFELRLNESGNGGAGSGGGGGGGDGGVVTVTVSGTDGRGVLYGVGRLVRKLNLTLVENYYTPRFASVTAHSTLSVVSWPDKPMRGVQMGYRPKTNSYDGLTPVLFESYVVDLVLFGANQIELIPGSFDDAPYSPHFALSHRDMNVAMSSILAKYHVNVSLWYPACHPGGDPNKGCETGNYHDPSVMAAAVAEWSDVYSSMPRIDTVFINAGDPGGQSPADLMMIAQRSREILLRYHPNADMWICPQDFSESDYAAWAAIAAEPATAAWMRGIIYGPGMPIPLDAFANSTAPQRYPVRLYPDVTHSLSDQLPVPNWDPAFHWTEGRETVNPRPTQEAAIAASQLAFADAGVSSYNEGAHDDVNKHVWLAVAWGCDADANDASGGDSGGGGASSNGSGRRSGRKGGDCNTTELVRARLTEFSRVHFGAEVADEATDLIYGLERGWVGPAATNPQINATYALMQGVLDTAPVRLRWRWRFQQLAYRANYDKLVQTRLGALLAGEDSALRAILGAGGAGAGAGAGADPEDAMRAAEAALDAADAAAAAAGSAYYTEMRVWAEALFQSIHEQFSVPIYGAEYTRRGANLDTALLPLSDAPFLRTSFAAVRRLPTKAQQSAALVALARWRDPGPGGYYDDMGQPGAMPRYVHPPFPQTGDQSLHPSPVVDATSPKSQRYQDPPRMHASARGVGVAPAGGLRGGPTDPPPSLPADQRRTQMTWVETTAPLTERTAIRLRYPGLPPNTAYNVTVTGLADKDGVVVAANGAVFFNGTVSGVAPDGTWVVRVPPPATRGGGDLVLAFSGLDGTAAPASAPAADNAAGSGARGVHPDRLAFDKDPEGIKLAEVWLRVLS